MKEGVKDILINKIILTGYCVAVIVAAYLLLRLRYPAWLET